MKLSPIILEQIMPRVTSAMREKAEHDLAKSNADQHFVWEENARLLLADNEGLSIEDAGYIAWRRMKGWNF